MLNLESIKSKLKKIKLFNKAERLISLRNLRPKKRGFSKSNFHFFFSWNYAGGFYPNHCYVSNERI